MSYNWGDMRKNGKKALRQWAKENPVPEPTTGRKKAIPKPEKLWDYACEYFQHVDDNPHQKQDFIRGGEMAGTIINMDAIRPYTWAGFEVYLLAKGIIQDLEDYRYNQDGRYSMFKGVIRMIDRVMYANKFDGAAVGAFNPSIIARDLGLVDKTETTVKEQPLFGPEGDEINGE